MPTFDAAATAALADEVQRPAFFVFLDIVGLPQRVTTAGYDVAFTGTGDPDLDDYTFEAIDPRLLDIGAVQQSESGSDTVTATLSGIAEFDDDLITVLEDRSLWRGRSARFWTMLRAEDGTAIGAVVNYHSGWMSAPSYNPSPDAPTISLKIEGYAASAAEASNRDYSGQAYYDPLDTSAAATVAAANGVKSGPGASVNAGGGEANTAGGDSQYVHLK